ncbi:MAG: ATP-binding protein, partial [Cyanobacteria bacterium J06648_1]
MKSNPEVKQYHLQVTTELEALKEVLQWFEGLVFPLVPQKMGWQCEVALVEASKSFNYDVELKICAIGI